MCIVRVWSLYYSRCIYGLRMVCLCYARVRVVNGHEVHVLCMHGLLYDLYNNSVYSLCMVRAWSVYGSCMVFVWSMYTVQCLCMIRVCSVRSMVLLSIRLYSNCVTQCWKPFRPGAMSKMGLLQGRIREKNLRGSLDF